MKKGMNVMFWDGSIEGVTIEDEANVVGSSRKVIRVRWSDKSETIENVKDLILLEPK